MLALEVEFLTGRCVATDREDRSAAEWPPHPVRLFAALAAAHFERKVDPAGETVDETVERAALDWLEGQPEPKLTVPPAFERTRISVFVPVNDSNDSKARIGEGYDLFRSRQGRFFPTVIPDPPVLHYVWNADPTEHRAALERLAAEVTYLGHSSSLVRVAVTDSHPAATLRPAVGRETAKQFLRVPVRGRLEQLRSAYDLSRELTRRIEPPEALAVGYVPADHVEPPPAPWTVFDDRLIVFRKAAGMSVSLRHSLSLTDKVRKALLSNGGDGSPEALSGHGPDGGPSRRTHFAVLPLAFVGHRHADGDIKGFAIALPRDLAGNDRQAVLQAIGKLERNLVFGRGDVRWTVEPLSADDGGVKSLNADAWTRPACCWATVTPVVFGRFPKGRGRRWMDSDEVRGMISEQIRQIELKDAAGNDVVPERIEVTEVSPILGVPPSPRFPTLSIQGKPVVPGHEGPRVPVRLRAHVSLRFATQVRGPLILGAGRYLGMGLFKPISNFAGTKGAQ